MDAGLDHRISRFYRRWHDLESTLGVHKGLVIDFDFAPRPQGGWSTNAFPNRTAAIDECTKLVGILERFLPGGVLAGDPAGPSNPSYSFAKLSGSLAYLWALVGERRPFDAYLTQTMGIRAHRVSNESLTSRRASAQAHCKQFEIPWSPMGGALLRSLLGRPDLHGFETELRAAAGEQCARLRCLLPDLPEPEYRIEVVREDAYWCNWIDGTTEDGVVLRVNTHPRHDYMKTSPLSLAAHEIAGHAAHVTTLRQQCDRGRVDGSSLNLTVHACDAFQMEGLAQVALFVLAEEGDHAGSLAPEHHLLDALRDLSGDRMGNAQLAVEAGQSMASVWQDLKRDLPLAGALSLRASLRDRSRSPLHRAYIHVYAPSKRMFSRILETPAARRGAVVRALYEELWTPGQIGQLIRGEDRDEVRQSHIPAPFA
ncbi:MAG: hypothetical protein CL927_04535 [Deltaproteobacteria bacterium]|mgnify:CR=1 FL=1|nr:hypothetical protein [Deltaproteobacteria bacterium]HCH65332.1 hypothetical protein [Deltaproteobacteria bacterium]